MLDRLNPGKRACGVLTLFAAAIMLSVQKNADLGASRKRTVWGYFNVFKKKRSIDAKEEQ